MKSGDGTLTAQLRSGALPTGSEPTVGASTSGAVLPGGSNIVAVTAGSNIDRVLVGVEGSDGYWELSGLGAAAAQSIILTFGQTAPSTFSLLFAGGSGGGVGPQAMVPVTLTPVGTGDVQVTVTWDADSDLDLHVVEPSGEEIFYGHPVSATGGRSGDEGSACWSGAPIGSADGTVLCGEPNASFTVNESPFPVPPTLWPRRSGPKPSQWCQTCDESRRARRPSVPSEPKLTSDRAGLTRRANLAQCAKPS